MMLHFIIKSQNDVHKSDAKLGKTFDSSLVISLNDLRLNPFEA